MRNIVVVWTVATVAAAVGAHATLGEHEAFARWLIISLFPIAPTVAAAGAEFVRAMREDVP